MQQRDDTSKGIGIIIVASIEKKHAAAIAI
jgi:hypothetical protein